MPRGVVPVPWRMGQKGGPAQFREGEEQCPAKIGCGDHVFAYDSECQKCCDCPIACGLVRYGCEYQREWPHAVTSAYSAVTFHYTWVHQEQFNQAYVKAMGAFWRECNARSAAENPRTAAQNQRASGASAVSPPA